jgi:hypothetical protein
MKEPQFRIKAAMMPQVAWLWCMFNMTSLTIDFGCAVMISSREKTWILVVVKTTITLKQSISLGRLNISS